METENFQVSQRQVTTITPLDTREIQLRVIDWRRLYRRISGMKTSIGSKEFFAGIAWGITGSCLLSLVPLYQATQTLDAWVKPTYWIVAIASGIVGVVIWKTMRDSAVNISETRREVLKDMEEIHCLYFPDEDLAQDTVGQSCRDQTNRPIRGLLTEIQNSVSISNGRN